jgi:hypothetical protein
MSELGSGADRRLRVGRSLAFYTAWGQGLVMGIQKPMT